MEGKLSGISAACSDISKDYFMEITIEGDVQSPRRRLTQFNYLRKDINETTSESLSVDGVLSISNILNFVLGGFIQELADSFSINKGLSVLGNMSLTSGLVASDATLSGGLTAQELTANNAVLSGSLNVTNAISANEMTLSSSLTVDEITANGLTAREITTEELALSGNLNVSGEVIAAEATISGELMVDGETKLMGDAEITGETKILSDLIVDGEISSGGVPVCLEDGTNCPDLLAGAPASGVVGGPPGGAGGAAASSSQTTLTGEVVVEGDIVPSATNTHSLGSVDSVWQDIYVGSGSVWIGDRKLSNTEGKLKWGDVKIGEASEAEAVIGQDYIQVDEFFRFNPTSAPGSPELGMVYLDSSSNELKFYDGSDWKTLVFDEEAVSQKPEKAVKALLESEVVSEDAGIKTEEVAVEIEGELEIKEVKVTPVGKEEKTDSEYKTHLVKILPDKFVPSYIHIEKGDKLILINKREYVGKEYPAMLVGGAGCPKFMSKELEKGDSLEIVFDEPLRQCNIADGIVVTMDPLRVVVDEITCTSMKTCGDWGDCINEYKTRQCSMVGTDCSRSESIESLSCYALNPFEEEIELAKEEIREQEEEAMEEVVEEPVEEIVEEVVEEVETAEEPAEEIEEVEEVVEEQPEEEPIEEVGEVEEETPVEEVEGPVEEIAEETIKEVAEESTDEVIEEAEEAVEEAVPEEAPVEEEAIAEEVEEPVGEPVTKEVIEEKPVEEKKEEKAEVKEEKVEIKEEKKPEKVEVPEPEPIPEPAPEPVELAPEEAIPDELFDITFDLEESVLGPNDKLVVWVSFQNFGKKYVPTRLVYRVTDQEGEEIYHEMEEIRVYTDYSIIKQFDYLSLKSGEYRLALNVEYAGIVEEAGADFKIQRSFFNSLKDWFKLVLGV